MSRLIAIGLLAGVAGCIDVHFPSVNLPDGGLANVSLGPNGLQLPQAGSLAGPPPIVNRPPPVVNAPPPLDGGMHVEADKDDGESPSGPTWATLDACPTVTMCRPSPDALSSRSSACVDVAGSRFYSNDVCGGGTGCPPLEADGKLWAQECIGGSRCSPTCEVP